jgi:hypothetical protein
MCKVSSQALASLATQENVADVINLYNEYFESIQEGEASSLVDEGQLSIQFGTAVKGADPGVEIELGMEPGQLASNLGFINELPVLFNTFRHKSGYTPWSHPDLFDNDNENLEPLRLFWHQLAGVHAIIRMNFQRTPSSTHCRGTLVADEVGLGKTFQASTVMVFLADLVQRQDYNRPLPPIISSSSPFVPILAT